MCSCGRLLTLALLHVNVTSVDGKRYQLLRTDVEASVDSNKNGSHAHCAPNADQHINVLHLETIAHS
jgi:hypothetical protein